uniref:Uncharacterized protein n=1 Tax=Panagrolaimus davidi TaxID=227884 RepID=A0A914PAS5_9BILA
MQQLITNNNNNASYFVLLPTTLNPRYLFPLPLAVESWKNIGVQPVTIFIGKESEFLLNNQSNDTLKFLKEQNVPVLFFEPKKLPEVSFSQIIRLFGAVFSFFANFPPDEAVLITSDADLMVFNLFNHIPNISEGKHLHLYNSQCCHPIEIPPKRGNYKVHMFPMGTIGATIKAWKDIMGFNKNVFTVDEIENYVINEFGEKFFKTDGDEIKRGSNIWFADQSLISYKIDEWLKM